MDLISGDTINEACIYGILWLAGDSHPATRRIANKGTPGARLSFRLASRKQIK